ncbi:MAG: efflux RND transporter permease subunit [Sphingorhabdus sp.]|jgi:multidrug efflux pump subunit AcrB|uniref:efflux RND transporter permease subunit n=3 Tax=Sphingorhabdus sp. TaxID=1902408 RepID=UPI00273DB0D1|nr:efflux RND transporter permease subunit [Sphingorhabdus sp.]MDP4757112.1 efflux RND transporter permease subunit [Sphingorhabdus sp.]MDP4926042.1 efflux RND transporter permease subunit [Sphingorhabdus sp.]
MNLNNISAWSIRNPVVPIVLFVALTLAGIMAFINMDVQNDPDIEFPVVVVSISQPGAAPTEITTQITQKVESAIRSVQGVRNIDASSTEGNTTISAEFEIGDDINAAVSEVKNAVDQIRSDLPDGILEPQIFKVATSSDPIAYFAVEASDMTLEQLSWFVDDTVARRLLSVEGMASVSRNGGVNREIRVVLDPAKMQSLGVSASQINAVLRQQNINASGGQSQIAGSRQSVRVLGNATNAFELSQTQISLSGGRSIKLADVAAVTDGFSEQRAMAFAGGKQVVTFGMSRAKGASDVTVFDDAMVKIAEIKKENPGINFITLFNSVDYTKGQYKSSMAAMIEGALLAIVVVFLFLRDWRATIISAIAIPLSAIPTFWFLDLMGFTLNTMSLLALGLVAGVLVDDAIVEIENIVRHMRMGKSAYQASIDAADEIGLAVVATTFSIVAVFLPVGLMPGVAGQFFKNFGLTVVASVLMSLAVARMITPMIAAYFLKSTGLAEHGEASWIDRYMKILRWSLGHRRWMMGIGAMALALTVALLVILPKQFFPDGDTDFSRVRIEMVPGTTLERTREIASEAAAIIEKQPEVKTALQSVREGGASIFITLNDDRARTSQQFEEDLTPLLTQIADARVTFQVNGPGGGGGGGSGRDVSVMLSGSDPKMLDKTAATLVEQMKGLPELRAPRISADLQRPELIITPRNDIASQLGVSTVALSQTIRIATLGDIDQNSAKFSLSDRQIPIRVMLARESRQSLDVIRNLPVPLATGGSVPLSRVADISFGAGPTSVQRRNQNFRTFVGADFAPGIVSSDADKKINDLPIMKNLPTGVSRAPFGSQEWEQEMQQDFLVALISGTLLVFAVLVLLYHRFMSPLVNMGSLLLAPLGGLVALALVGQPISMPVFIGILMLFGIVAKNSILLIDFAIEEMARGVPKFQAIMEAGHKRAQPIVMTTVAMTAGMVPTALSLGGDGQWRSPMGTVVIGGLIVSTLLTLLIVPAGFSLADGFEKRIGPWLRSRLLTYDPTKDKEIVAEPAKPTGNAPGKGDLGGLQPAE